MSKLTQKIQIYTVNCEVIFLSENGVTYSVWKLEIKWNLSFPIDYVPGNLCNIARLQATWDKDPGLFCTIFSNAIGHAVCDPVDVLRLGNLEVGYIKRLWLCPSQFSIVEQLLHYKGPEKALDLGTSKNRR